MNANGFTFIKGFWLMAAAFLTMSCQNQNRENVGRIEPNTAKKSYSFDSAKGCYSDGIVNGNMVNQENPLKTHVVMLLTRFQQTSLPDSEVLSTLCTGTLVGDNTVLTAAHCFPKNSVSTQVIASINLFCSSGFSKQLVYPTRQIIIHPDYRDKGAPSISAPDYDVAIVKFDGILPPEYTYLPLERVDVLNEMNNKNSQMVMVGYGRTKTLDDTLPELRYVMKPWDKLVLTKESQSLIDRLGLIGVNQSDSKGGCSGDSGGPLLAVENGRFKILGVASYIESRSESTLCEQGQIYYSYIPAYWDWIIRQLP